MTRSLLDLLNSEKGHGGAVVATLLALAGMVVMPIGLAGDSDWLAIAGAVCLGLGVVVAVNAPHLWVVRIYRRLDRMSPDDPDAKPGSGINLEF